MRRLVLFAALALLLSGCSPLTSQSPANKNQVAEAAAPVFVPTTPLAETPAQTSAATSVFSPTGEVFEAADLTAAAAPALATPEQVQQALGPADREEITHDASGRLQTIWWYQNNRLIFRENQLVEAELSNLAIAGPRGLRVGDTLSMLEKTYGLTGSGNPYYAAENGLPPRAEKLAFSGDTRYTVILTAPMEAYTPQQLAQTRGYMEALHGQLVYTLDQSSQRITSIHWIVAPLSENAQ